MTGRSFWILTFLLTATACHLAFVLFTPAMNSEELYQSLIARTGTNKLTTLNIQQTYLLSSYSDTNMVHAVCPYDLSLGPVILNAKFPNNYWSMNIYTMRGDVIYTLNDRQANSNEVSILISAADSKTQSAPLQDIGMAISSSIEVVSQEYRGLAVLRGSTISEREIKRVSATLSLSDCQHRKGTS